MVLFQERQGKSTSCRGLDLLDSIHTAAVCQALCTASEFSLRVAVSWAGGREGG